MSPLEPVDAGEDDPAGASAFIALADSTANARYRLCANYVQHDVCNWAIPIEQESPLVSSCALNVDVPATDAADATLVWARLEAAKRRLLYSLLGLRLPTRSALT